MARSSAKSLTPDMEDAYPHARTSDYDNPLHSRTGAGAESEGRARYSSRGASRDAIRETVAEIHQEFTAKHGSDEHSKPLMIATLIVARPRTCCAFWCCFYFFFTLFLTLVLSLGGFDPINTERVGEVGLSLPFDEYTLREQAFLRTTDIADYAAPEYDCRQSDPRSFVNLIVETTNPDSNILTTKGLLYMEEVERHMVTQKGFDTHCYLNTDECSELTGGLKTSPTCCVTPILKDNVTDAHGCFLPRSPVYFFRKYGDPGFTDPRGTIQRIKNESASDWANFQATLHKHFPDDEKTSRFASINLYFAVPQTDVYNASATDNPELRKSKKKRDDDDEEDVEKWIDKTYSSYFEKQYNKKPYHVLYYYSGYDPVGTQVLQDLGLAVFGILLVYLYMWRIFGSLFIASAAMFEIFCAFFGGNLIYRYLWPTPDGIGYESYFTLFQALSVFIILGIGADDCFVFTDVWNDTKKQKGHGGFGADSGANSMQSTYYIDAQRLSHAYRHAGKAMLVTSLTTIFSFLSNLQSEFPLIAAFGTYAALLVMVNYAIVVTYFPCVILCYHSIWGRQADQQREQEEAAEIIDTASSRTSESNHVTHDLHDIDEAGESMTSSKVGASESAGNAEAEATLPPRTPSSSSSSAATASVSLLSVETCSTRCKGGGGKKRKKPFRLPDWLSEVYAPWILAHRRGILLFFAAFVLCFLVLACLVEAVPFLTYTLFPPGSNFYDVLYTTQTQFSSLASPLYAYVIFGIKEGHPLEYENDFRRYDFEGGSDGDGTPQYDPFFDITTPEAQSQMLETCYLIYNQELASAKSLKADLELGINPQLQPGEDASTNAGEFGVQCPFSAFAQFENSGMAWRAEDGAFAAKHPPPEGSWKNVINDGGEDDDYVVGRCRSCFTNFSVAVAPNGDPSEESVKYSTDTYEYAFPTTAQSIANTSSVVDGCNCVGIFPIPFQVCLDELSYLSDGTRFKCSGSNLNFLQDYRAFMRASTDNFNWWKNYIYATESAEESFEKIVMTYVKVQTTLSENENDFKMGLDMLEKWDKWTHDYNAYIDAKVETSSSISSTYSPAKAMVYIPAAQRWKVASILAPNAVANTLLSLALAFVVVLLATFNYIIACISVLNVGFIVTIIFGCFYAFGWQLGLLESILCVIVVGFAIDFSLHLVDSYLESDGMLDSVFESNKQRESVAGSDRNSRATPTEQEYAGRAERRNRVDFDDGDAAVRYEKVREALSVTGVSIISGSLSTLLATFPMFFAQITFFSKFGTVMFMTMFLSTLFSLLPLPALLMEFGPVRRQGMLSAIYGPYVKRAYAQLEHEEEKELLAFKSSSEMSKRIMAKRLKAEEDWSSHRNIQSGISAGQERSVGLQDPTDI